MREVWSWSPLKIGFALIPLNVVPLLTAAVAGKIVDKQGPRPMVIFGGVWSGVSFSNYWFSLWKLDTTFALGLLVSGLGAMAIGNSFDHRNATRYRRRPFSWRLASYTATPWTLGRFDSVHCKEPVGFRFQRCLHLGVDFRSGRLPSRIFNTYLYYPRHNEQELSNV